MRYRTLNEANNWLNQDIKKPSDEDEYSEMLDFCTDLLLELQYASRKFADRNVKRCIDKAFNNINDARDLLGTGAVRTFQ